ncbi:MAG TPA: hypothetical protein VIJ51_01365 [Solirubrobacteraceae bacterium]
MSAGLVLLSLVSGDPSRTKTALGVVIVSRLPEIPLRPRPPQGASRPQGTAGQPAVAEAQGGARPQRV